MATQSNSNSIQTSNVNQSANQPTFPSLIFTEINELGLQHFDAVMDWLGLNGEYQGQEYLCLNPLRPEDSTPGSFKINSKSGLWSDFAIDEAGGDLISFVAYVKNISYKQAALLLKSLLIGTGATTVIESTHNDGGRQASQDQTKSKPEHNELICVMPVPDDAPELPKQYGNKGIPAGIYFYRNAEGQLLFHVLRFESTGGKSFSPLSLFRNTEGILIWKMKGIAGQKPLYNLHLLAKFAERPVLIVEGEKAADAAALLFPDHVVVTTSNGAKAADKTDFSPLKGRNVFIWPDNDKAGEEYAADLVRLLRVQDKECQISIMKPLAFAVSSDLAKNAALVPGFEPEKGFDAADAFALGWTAAHIKLLPDDAWEVVSADTSYYVANDDYLVSDDGVHRVKKSDHGEFYTWICAPLHVTALSRDERNTNWGIVLDFKDADNVAHKWCMPKSMLAGGNEYRKTLLKMGLDVTQQNGQNDLLADYMLRANPVKRAIAVTKPGWYKNSFVFPEWS